MAARHPSGFVTDTIGIHVQFLPLHFVASRLKINVATTAKYLGLPRALPITACCWQDWWHVSHIASHAHASTYGFSLQVAISDATRNMGRTPSTLAGLGVAQLAHVHWGRDWTACGGAGPGVRAVNVWRRS